MPRNIFQLRALACVIPGKTVECIGGRMKSEEYHERLAARVGGGERS
jgi:pyruvoyl-dependent arginine decarboxylase (PvlArgDC)